MAKRMDSYHAALQAAHPGQLAAANREARLTIYKALAQRYGAERLGCHLNTIRSIMDKAYAQEQVAHDRPAPV